MDALIDIVKCNPHTIGLDGLYIVSKIESIGESSIIVKLIESRKSTAYSEHIKNNWIFVTNSTIDGYPIYRKP